MCTTTHVSIHYLVAIVTVHTRRTFACSFFSKQHKCLPVQQWSPIAVVPTEHQLTVAPNTVLTVPDSFKMTVRFALHVWVLALTVTCLKETGDHCCSWRSSRENT